MDVRAWKSGINKCTIEGRRPRDQGRLDSNISEGFETGREVGRLHQLSGSVTYLSGPRRAETV